jgi:hypothetical protein
MHAPSTPWQVSYNLLNPSPGGAVPAGYPAQDYGNLLSHMQAAEMGVINIRVLAAGALSGTEERHPLGSESLSSAIFADRSDPPERSRCCKSLVELVGANDRRSELCDGGIGRIAPPVAPSSTVAGDRGFGSPVDELMTMQCI